MAWVAPWCSVMTTKGTVPETEPLTTVRVDTSAPFVSVLPNAITFIGHALTLAWLCGAPWPVGLLGLILDAIDGAVARRLKATTEYGSLYDWTVDVTCAAVIASRLDIVPLLAIIVPAQAWLRLKGKHTSGRAALVVIAIVVAWIQRYGLDRWVRELIS